MSTGQLVELSAVNCMKVNGAQNSVLHTNGKDGSQLAVKQYLYGQQ